jgi:hypothetical protein
MAINVIFSSLLEISREGTPQRGNQRSNSCFLNAEHLEEKNRSLFEESESNVLSQKFSFLRSLSDWVTVHVTNFDAVNLVDLISFFFFFCKIL